MKKEPIYVSFFSHNEASYIRGFPLESYSGDGPVPPSVKSEHNIDLWEKYGIKGEYATTAVCLQQLLEDFPETIEKIKRLKIPISRYGGTGHGPKPHPVGQMRDTSGLTLEEAIVAEWEFQTHMLIPDWHFEDGRIVLGNPKAGKPVTLEELPEYNIPQKEYWLYGGDLAIQKIMGVTPLPYGEAFAWRAAFKSSYYERVDIWPVTPVKMALGVGSYEPSYNPGELVTEVPMTGSLPTLSVRIFKYIAETWLRKRPLYVTCAFVQGKSFEEIVEFLLANPDDFKIVSVDPEARQWMPENSPLEFYRKTYSAKSLEDILNMPCPVDKIKEVMKRTLRERGVKRDRDTSSGWEGRLLSQAEIEAMGRPEYLQPVWLTPAQRGQIPDYLRSKERRVSLELMIEAADYLLTHWPLTTHDGDFGGPPDYVESKGEYLSLAETFQAFAYALEHYAIHNELPEGANVKEVLGPIDYPMYKLEEEPKFDPSKRVGGTTSYELKQELFPDPKIVESQGLPATPTRGEWTLTVFADPSSILHSASLAAEHIRENEYIPGVIEIFLPLPQKGEGATPGREVRESGFSFFRGINVRAKVNSAELLYAMAQEIRIISVNGLPGTVMLNSMKIIADQPCRCVVPSTPVSFKRPWDQPMLRDGSVHGFIWRGKVPIRLINATWTYKPKTGA